MLVTKKSLLNNLAFLYQLEIWDTRLKTVCKWIADPQKYENSKTWEGRIGTYRRLCQKWALHLPLVLRTKKSKSLEKVRFKMRSEGENKSFNVEFIWNAILVNWMSTSIENYKIMFSGSPFKDVLLHNKPKLFNCSKNILGGLPCMYKTNTHSHKKKLLIYIRNSSLLCAVFLNRKVLSVLAECHMTETTNHLIEKLQ
jgi:hypothetical protein